MLSQKILISNQVLNELQAFHFRSTVHTNTTPTVITHSYVLQKPPFCKMVLKIVVQIGTSVSFWPKKVKCPNFEGNCVPNDSTGKVATWGGS